VFLEMEKRLNNMETAREVTSRNNIHTMNSKNSWKRAENMQTTMPLYKLHTIILTRLPNPSKLSSEVA